MKRTAHNIAVALGSLSFLLVAQLAGYSGKFALLSIFGPLSGAIHLFGAGVWIVFATALRVVLNGGHSIPLGLVTYGIPTFIAACAMSGYANKNQKNLNWYRLGFEVAVPLLCIILFSVGPNTYMPYSFYWVIPPVFYGLSLLVNNSTLRMMIAALSCTFIAHAVGSVMWMLQVPMTEAAWHALIPVVIVERMRIAAVMVFVQVSAAQAALAIRRLTCKSYAR